MKRFIVTSCVFALAVCGQAPRGCKEQLTAISNGIKTALADPQADKDQEIRQRLGNTIGLFLCLGGSVAAGQVQSILEANRIDKQTGGTASTGGATNLVSSGLAARLISVANEYGGILQTVNANTVTIRTNPAMLVASLGKISPQLVYNTSEGEPITRFWKQLNVGATFDTSRGAETSKGTAAFQANYKQLTEVSARFELVNRRDLYRTENFERIRDFWSSQTDLANAVNALDRELVQLPEVTKAQDDAVAGILGGTDPVAAMDTYGKKLQQLSTSNARVRELSVKAIERTAAAIEASVKRFEPITRKLAITGEYVYARPPLTTVSATAATNAGAMASAIQSPDLHTLRILGSRGLAWKSDWTFSASANFFHQALPTMRGNFRDVQFGTKIDIPVPGILSESRGKLTFAGLFAHLHQRPLGLDFVLNDPRLAKEKINKPGSMGLFQAGFTIPFGDSGLKLPLSITYASRTELIKESDVRANFGITFDLDTLLAKKK